MLARDLYQSNQLNVGDDPFAAQTPSFTTEEAAEYLNRGGASWKNDLGQALTVTYAYRAQLGNASEEGFSRFSAQQINVAEGALASWADVANITFDRVGSGTSGAQAYSNDATILLGNFEDPGGAGAAHAYLPNPSATGSFLSAGDVWVNVAYDYEADPVFWEYGVLTLVHELGHALGLEHPGDYNASDGEPITYADDAEYKQDTRQYSVMSYFSEKNTGADFKGFFSAAPMLHDIAAMQRLYGANMETRTGNDTYGFNSNTGIQWYEADDANDPLIFSVWDAGGKKDTFDFSGYNVNQLITLVAEDFSNVGGMIGNISIFTDVVIENAIGGTKNDKIIGNDAGNSLWGMTGKDNLSGGKGADSLYGGAGTDTLAGGLGNDKFFFDAASDTAKNIKLADRILDLENGDTINLKAIDANTTKGGDQKFILGGDAFDGIKGELIVWYDNGADATYIQGDTNGDGVADFTIRANGDHADFDHFVL